MKNFSKLFGIISLVVIIGFSMMSCSTTGGGGGGGSVDKKAYVNIDFAKTFPDGGLIIQLSLSDGVDWKTNANNGSFSGVEISDIWSWFAFTDPNTGDAIFTDILPKDVKGQTVYGLISFDPPIGVGSNWNNDFNVTIVNSKLEKIRGCTDFTGSLLAGDPYQKR